VMREDGYGPDHGRPSYEWLAEHGFSGLSYRVSFNLCLFSIDLFRRLSGLSAAIFDYILLISHYQTYIGMKHKSNYYNEKCLP
jgi:hypothetical protein